MNDVLILGDGLLGNEIYQITGWDYISRKKDNIDINFPTSYIEFLNGYSTVLNCIGYTNTYSDERDEHWNTNFLAVMSLVDILNDLNKKLVHISSDYVYAGSDEFATENDVPVHAKNWYSYTKLLGEGYVQARSKQYLLIRTSFKPHPFPYEKAITTQEGNFDYVNNIAEKIVRLIELNAYGVYNVGRAKMGSIYDLALETRLDVKPLSEKLHPSMPTNITMDISKMIEFLEAHSDEN